MTPISVRRAAQLLAALAISLLGQASVGAQDRDEILILEPAPGARVNSALVGLKGRVVGNVDNLVISSSASVGVLQIADAKFRVSTYLWADSTGQLLPLQLTAARSPSTRTELALEFDRTSADDVETALALHTAALAGGSGQSDALDTAHRLIDGGHPIFARILLDRIAASDPAEPALLASLALGQVTVAVLLQNQSGALVALPRVVAVEDGGRSPRRMGERLFALSDLALLQSRDRKLAKMLLERGNALFQEAGLLPRRMLKGY